MLMFNFYFALFYVFQDISKNRVIIKEGTICLQSVRKPYKVLGHLMLDSREMICQNQISCLV